MKVSGFSFIRNGTLLGYPFVESIRSVLPLCDEFVISVGQGEDDTLERIRAIQSPKIQILQTQWNEKMHDRGFVYAQQKMIAQYHCTGDWAFYLEGDEVVHEKDLPAIRECMQRHLENRQVDAIAFHFHHFFGSAEWESVSPGWYRREPRIIRNTIRTWAPDGLYWVVMDRQRRGRYPRAAVADAAIYHYGFVRSVESMNKKIARVTKYWGSTAAAIKRYETDPMGLARFQGTHPAVIHKWIEEESERGFAPDPDYRITRKERKYRMMMRLERLFGWDLSRRHFKPFK
ncbi:MAG: glycosyltransferase [Planctomycetes bacterium]|nr:glycosyltransferase [Planctomycetota bacterium]